MKKVNIIRNKEYSDEPPTVKIFIVVIVVLLVLIALSWLAYYKWHILN